VEDEGLEQATPAVRDRIRASFDRQGLMGHLGARLSHIGPGRVHIVLPARPEVTQQQGAQRSLVAAGQQTLICIEARAER
jgi:hypothetical protein